MADKQINLVSDILSKINNKSPKPKEKDDEIIKNVSTELIYGASLRRLRLYFYNKIINIKDAPLSSKLVLDAFDSVLLDVILEDI